MKSLLPTRLTTFFTKLPNRPDPPPPSATVRAPRDALFPAVDPAVDGPDCLRDCATCTIRYPAKFSIDEDDELYGHVNGWATHVLVATGKTDWVRDVADERGSVMEALAKGGARPENGVR